MPVERGNEEDKGEERDEDEEEGLSASQVVVKMKSTKQKGSQPNPNNSKEKQRKKKVTKGSEETRIHYVSQECPLCKKKVCNLTRHLVNLNVHKNECIPMARVKPLKEMAVHGNKTQGGREVRERKSGVRKVYRRHKEICPKCDTVVLYLSKHLRKKHHLDKTSDEYKTLMGMARKYYGKAAEMLWDQELINKKRKRQPSQAFTSGPKRQRYHSPSEAESTSEGDRRKLSPLKLLALEDMTSDTSDETYFDATINEIPGTPQKTASVINVRGSRQRKDSHSEEVSSNRQEEVADDEDEGKNGEVADDEDEGENGEEDNGESEDSADDTDGSADDESDSESEDEIANFETWKDYCRDAKGSEMIDRLLIQYYHHLQNILGGCKKERDAIWHAQNVRRIKNAINSKDCTLNCLIVDGGLNIWRKWAKPILDNKKVKPGTIRASLTSMVKFFEFVVDYTEHGVKDMPQIDQKTIDHIKRVIPRCLAMGASVNQLYAHERWEQLLEDQVNAVDPQDTCQMVDTEPAKQAIAFLMKSRAEKPTMKEYLTIRDFLIARLGLENGQRPGPLETARIRDFERITQTDDKYIMYVSRHKNSKAGPAPLTMSDNLKSNLEVYLKRVRPFVANDDEQAIFTTDKGVAFAPGTEENE